MIIGVDAGALSIKDERLRVGVWRVTYNLLKELSKIDKKNEYRLYSFIPIDREVMKVFSRRMRNVIVRPTLAWSVIQLPIELRRHKVDVFLGLSQMVPYSTSYNIGFIYDLGFLHFPDAYPRSLNKLKSQTKNLVDRADHIVAISEVTKRDIAHEYKADAKYITVAYPGVDTRFKPAGAKHKEKNPYILFVGALKRGKNIPFTLRVFKKFLDKVKKPYDLVLVGGNYWEDPEITETIKKLKLGKRIRRTGFLPDTELPKYYRGAEALIVTSLWEGFCLPAAEAMACGCPVVYAKTGSLPEIVGNAGTGFESGNEAAAVKAFMHHKSGVSGIRRSRQFTWPRFAEAVYRIITVT